MAQSNLYKFGSSTAQTVEVTDDDTRDLGDVDVKSFSGAIDVSDRHDRLLGETEVTNTVGVSPQAPTPVEDANGNQISPATEATLASVLQREVSVWSAGVLPVDASSPFPLEDAAGNQIDPATAGDVQGVQTELQNRLDNHPGIEFGRATVSTSGSPVALAGSSTPVPPNNAIAIQAVPGNSNPVYVGDSTVDTTTGYPLQAGQVVTLQSDDLANVYVDADSGGDSVAYIVEAN